MGDKSREPLLVGDYAAASHGIRQAEYYMGFSPHLISGGLGLTTHNRPLSKTGAAEEAYDFGELDGFPATGAALHGDKSLLQHKRPTLNILSAASAMLDISSKMFMPQHSPQTTSTSAVSNHTASCRSTPSAFQSPFQSPSTGNQSWGTHMTINHQTATSYNMEDELKSLESKKIHNISLDSKIKSEHVPGRSTDTKTLRRLAQNREAARKSRLRKKAYVQQLEASRAKLGQMEQDLMKARQPQGVVTSGAFYSDMSTGATGFIGPHNTGAAAFNMEYAHWLDEKSRLLGDLKMALRAQLSDDDLQILVESLMSHYDEIFQRKSIAVKADVFHLLSGMWKTPAERCFLWMGGFRPSEILKIILPQIEPLTEPQLMGVYNLQQSSQQAEDALSQGMDTLQQTLAETLAWGPFDSPDSSMSTYLNQMALAMQKLGTLESFLRQADHLRQQTLKQMQRLLTMQQMARGLLAMGEYLNRLRALSSLWLARPKD